MTDGPSAPEQSPANEGYFGPLRRRYEPIRLLVAEDLQNSGIQEGSPEYKQAVAKQTKRLMRAREEAEKDGDFEILNKKGFHSRLNSELPIAQKAGVPVLDIVFDLQRLKYVNDSPGLGHSFGNLYLETFIQSVQEHIRVNDIFARYGKGDEFRLALFGLNSAEFNELWEKMQETFQERGVLVGAGVANMDFEDPNRSYIKADDALYIAKGFSDTSDKSEIYPAEKIH